MTLCDIRAHDRIIIATLPRSIDHVSAPVLERELKACVTLRPGSLLCDMTATTYVSSAGFRMFITIGKMADVSAVHFGLFSLTPYVDHVFDLPGFGSLFAIYGTEDEAVTAALAV